MSRSSVAISMDTSKLAGRLGILQERVDKAIRPAAQAGAQVLYDEVMRNVSRIEDKGTLSRAIYQVYSHKHSNEKRAKYFISWNYTKAPHGHLLENGWLQRYKVEFIKGKYYTVRRPGMEGKPKPSAKNRAAMDAFWEPRPGGPLFHKGKRFVRNAIDFFPQAEAAIKQELTHQLKIK